MSRHSLLLAIALLTANVAVVSSPVASVVAAERAVDREGVELFETKVRPVLSAHCFKCHSGSAERLKADLRLDSRAAILKGGVSGPAIVPGKPAESLLIKALRHDPILALEMPPQAKLADAVIADLENWIRSGALWPATAENSTDPKHADVDRVRREHWAFQPLQRPLVPEVADRDWVKTPIDALIFAKLEGARMRPGPAADPRTLLRRVYFDLIGLPPTPAEQHEFLQSFDSTPDAWERLVDRLLGLPQYGERWGRHWLDVARFAESQGYERDDPKPYAWRYRDYVIAAFNQDKPYDRFVLEQLASDELEGSDAEALTAVSFLRLGPFDTIAADATLARYDQLDDVVGTVTAAFLGQSLRCARCHDHKFEPFRQEEYYQFLSVFDPLNGKNMEATHVGSAGQLAAYKSAQAAVDAALEPLEDERDRVFTAILDAQPPAAESAESSKRNQGQRPVAANVLAALRKPAAQRSKQDKEQLTRSRQRIQDQFVPLATDEQRRQLQTLEDRIRRLDASRPAGHFAYVFAETTTTPGPTYLFLRGDVNRTGPQVQPAVPSVLSGDGLAAPEPTSQTSGRRLWMAKWIVGPGQALAARVMANRIWQYHFGTGIVGTANDFGLHGDRPTHPELLEWLAAELVAGNWSIKQLHRAIVLSSVYQTSAAHRADDRDPDGRLLAHWRTRRLEAEAVRDAILAVSGRLNLQAHGPSVFPPLSQKLVGASAGLEWKTSDAHQSARRSVYVYVKRNIALPELEVLGTADASVSMDRRTTANTALQALMLLNSRFVTEHAIEFAETVAAGTGDKVDEQVELAFELAIGRLPDLGELAASVEFIEAQGRFPTVAGELKLTPLASFCLVLMNTNEFLYLK